MPILFGALLVLSMVTWRKGTAILAEKARRQEISLRDLVNRFETKPPHRVPGTAIFLTGDPEGAPSALLHNLKHNKMIHERNIILNIRTESTPRWCKASRYSAKSLSLFALAWDELACVSRSRAPICSSSTALRRAASAASTSFNRAL